MPRPKLDDQKNWRMKFRTVELTLLPLLRPAHEPVGEVPVGHLLGGPGLLHRDERRRRGRRRRVAVGGGESGGGRVVRRRHGGRRRRRRQALHAEALLHGHGRGPHVQLHPEQPHAAPASAAADAVLEDRRPAVPAAGPRVVAIVPTARALPSHGRHGTLHDGERQES